MHHTTPFDARSTDPPQVGTGSGTGWTGYRGTCHWDTSFYRSYKLEKDKHT